MVCQRRESPAATHGSIWRGLGFDGVDRISSADGSMCTKNEGKRGPNLARDQCGRKTRAGLLRGPIRGKFRSIEFLPVGSETHRLYCRIIGPESKERMGGNLLIGIDGFGGGVTQKGNSLKNLRQHGSTGLEWGPWAQILTKGRARVSTTWTGSLHPIPTGIVHTDAFLSQHIIVSLCMKIERLSLTLSSNRFSRRSLVILKEKKNSFLLVQTKRGFWMIIP